MLVTNKFLEKKCNCTNQIIFTSRLAVDDGLLSVRFNVFDRFQCSNAFAAAIDSITKVAVRKDINARRTIITVDNNQPASWKAAGRVSAPVPTIRLNM